MGKARYHQLRFDKVSLISIKDRKSKVTQKDFARVIDPKEATLEEFFDSFPKILAAEDLRAFADTIVHSWKKKKPVIVMIGAHVIKVGLSPLLIDLINRGIITHLAMNSAAAIHDVETAMWGKTSEDVAVNILDGKFGMSKETGDFINGTLSESFSCSEEGYGESLGNKLLEVRAPNRSVSLLARCVESGTPVTVHAAIGTDIIHQQNTMNGAATGELSYRDFRVLANSVKDLRGGGIVMNIGSAVILPEVFLKALTVARNLRFKAKGFTTANFDMIRQYRPMMNVVERPTQNHGKGYNFVGHHEIMIPLLAALIKTKAGKV
ncbi:MAG: hypothetical protein V1799_10900 [bacterium]